MLFIATTVLSAPPRHQEALYIALGIAGAVVIIAIAVALLVLVLRNIGGQWPIR